MHTCAICYSKLVLSRCRHNRHGDRRHRLVPPTRITPPLHVLLPLLAHVKDKDGTMCALIHIKELSVQRCADLQGESGHTELVIAALPLTTSTPTPSHPHHSHLIPTHTHSHPAITSPSSHHRHTHTHPRSHPRSQSCTPALTSGALCPL